MKKIVVCAAMLLAAGCAKAPQDIAPTPVASEPYMQMECSQLSSVKAQKDAEYAEIAKHQLEAARYDATAMAIVHVPVASWAGKDKEEDYARIKGEKQAIDRAYQSKGCMG